MSLDTEMLKGVPSSGASSENRLRIKYRTRRCDDTLDFDPNPCNTDDNGLNPWAYGDMVLTTPVYHSFELDIAELRQVCEGQDWHYQDLLLETYQTIRRKLNAKFIGQIGANTGKYFAPDCDDAVAVSDYIAPIGFFDTNGNPKPMGFSKIEQTYRRFGFPGRPVIIGGDPVDVYQGAARRIFAGNTSGFDANRGGENMFSDYQLNGVLANGNENVLTFAPGAIHDINWYQFKAFPYASPTTVKRTLDLGRFFGMPAGALEVDHTVHIQECGDEIKVIYKFWKYADLFMLTSDMLAEACGQCSNSILLWNHDCADPACSDISPIIVAP